MNMQQQFQTMEEIVKSGFLKNVPKVGELVEGTIIQITRGLLRIDIPGVKTGVVRGIEFLSSPESSSLKIGDRVSAAVIDVDNEKGELELSLKREAGSGFLEKIMEKKREKAVIDIQIQGANRGGLLVSFEGLKGFLPVSQLSLEHYPEVPGGDREKILEKLSSFVHQIFKAVILDIDPKAGTFIVSERAAKGEDQKTLLTKYELGQVVPVSVIKLIDSGVFVEIERGLTGFIHISELAWHYLPHPSSVAKIGDRFDAKIIGVEGEKVFLSRRKLLEDPWKAASVQYQVGQKIKGKILKITPFGFFVEVATEIHGLAHLSQLSKDPVSDPLKLAAVGDTLEFTIVAFDPKEHRLGLSLIQ